MKTASRDSRCPLCDTFAAPIFELGLAPKPPLPDTISFRWCNRCDFIFAERLETESYRQFYRSALQDTAHVSDSRTADNLHQLQARLIGNRLGTDFCGNCLDFGSGEGQLLTELATVLPNAGLFGTDLRNSLRPGTPARFLECLDIGPGMFDAIILSHVAEHLVDLHELSGLLNHLAPDGMLYVEVPDPLGYPACPRREFMYYFDRLHVNHFSQTALSRWLGAHSMTITQEGSHRFAYRDGQYPAQYVFASRGVSRSGGGISSSIRNAFYSYREAENARSTALRNFIAATAGSRDLIAYGRGDNYFRAKSPGGPIQGLCIKAVLDRNARAIPATDEEILLPDVGLGRYPEAVVLMAVSAGTDEIVAGIREQNPAREIIMI